MHDPVVRKHPDHQMPCHIQSHVAVAGAGSALEMLSLVSAVTQSITHTSERCCPPTVHPTSTPRSPIALSSSTKTITVQPRHSLDPDHMVTLTV
jgi:hypothetical protein